MLTVKEIKDMYRGQYDHVEYYAYESPNATQFFNPYTPVVCDDTTPVIHASIMREREYNSKILQGFGTKFTDFFEKKDKVLVVVIKE